MKEKKQRTKLTREQIKNLQALEPDALPLAEGAKDLLDMLPEEDEFESPHYDKPVPGEGP
ncbi:MAG: hypothetical protein KDC53_08160 [Saprospiraceae bacterium]|nr:hypothetical protein [Saprospiraceae bacterium]